MLQADRSLDAIYTHERPDRDMMRSMFRQLFQAVDFLHKRRILHGDIKMLNIVRTTNLAYKLIDLDASVPLDDQSFVGAKFSSGDTIYLPMSS